MNDKIEEFSEGMWRLKGDLVPYDGDRPEMSVEDITPFLIETETEEPLLIRLRGIYLQVWTSGSIPYKHIAIPEEYEEIFGIEFPQSLYILIVKNQDKMKQVLDSSEDSLAWKISEEEFNGGKVP